MNKRIVVAITGASGAAYAVRLLECLARSAAEIHLIISPYGRRLLLDELDVSDPTPRNLVGEALASAIRLHPHRDVGDCLASGSFLTSAMIVCPCSSNTLGEVAAGLGGNLISRAAAVHLKEGRKLILVPRETPVSQIELRNMLHVSKAGGTICPASPGFYLRPKTVDDLVDFVVGKLCDLVGVAHGLDTRWLPESSGRSEDAGNR